MGGGDRWSFVVGRSSFFLGFGLEIDCLNLVIIIPKRFDSSISECISIEG